MAQSEDRDLLGGLSEQQLQYVLWAATPEMVRDPVDASGFAVVLGVSRQTLWRWSKDARIAEAIRFVVLQNAGDPDRIHQVLDMLHDVAVSDRNVSAAKEWLEAVGVRQMWVRNRDSRVRVAVDSAPKQVELSELSVEELRGLVAEAVAEVAEEDAISKVGSVVVVG